MEKPGDKQLEAGIEKLEQRLNILENKLRTTFQEVERRFDMLRKKGEEYDAEERITELEDLLLLQQLEVTKLKDKAGLSVDIGLTPETPSLAERLNRLEHEISIAGSRGFVSGQDSEPEEPAEERSESLYASEALEEAAGSAEDMPAQEHEDTERIAPAITPAAPGKARAAQMRAKRSGILDDVNEILGMKAHA